MRIRNGSRTARCRAQRTFPFHRRRPELRLQLTELGGNPPTPPHFNDGYSPTTDTAQPGPQRPIQARFDMTVPISLIRLALLLRRLRVPQVDVQTLDLFDQQENRLSRRAKLLIAVRKETRAPGAKLLDLALVQTIAQRSVHQVQGSVRQP